MKHTNCFAWCDDVGAFADQWILRWKDQSVYARRVGWQVMHWGFQLLGRLITSIVYFVLWLIRWLHVPPLHSRSMKHVWPVCFLPPWLIKFRSMCCLCCRFLSFLAHCSACELQASNILKPLQHHVAALLLLLGELSGGGRETCWSGIGASRVCEWPTWLKLVLWLLDVHALFTIKFYKKWSLINCS